MPDKGDRVRVEFEGTLEYVDSRYSTIILDGGPSVVNVPASAITVLPKPYRVGDELVLGEGEEPPIGTVLMMGDSTVWVHRRALSWLRDGSMNVAAWNNLPHVYVRVIHLP